MFLDFSRLPRDHVVGYLQQVGHCRRRLLSLSLTMQIKTQDLAAPEFEAAPNRFRGGVTWARVEFGR